MRGSDEAVKKESRLVEESQHLKDDIARISDEEERIMEERDEAVNASFIHDRACDSEHDIVARGTTLLPIAHGSSPVVSLEAHPILEEEFPGRFVDAGKHATHHNARCSHRQSLDSRPCACDAAVCDHRNAIGPC